LLLVAARLAQFDGIFVLCSLHGSDLLAPLLATPALDMHASLHPLGRGGSMGTVAICRKGTRSCSAGGHGKGDRRDVDEDALRQEEQFIMDDYYKAQNPLLGAEQVATHTHTHTLPLVGWRPLTRRVSTTAYARHV